MITAEEVRKLLPLPEVSVEKELEYIQNLIVMAAKDCKRSIQITGSRGQFNKPHLSRTLDAYVLEVIEALRFVGFDAGIIREDSGTFQTSYLQVVW